MRSACVPLRRAQPELARDPLHQWHERAQLVHLGAQLVHLKVASAVAIVALPIANTHLLHLRLQVEHAPLKPIVA